MSAEEDSAAGEEEEETAAIVRRKARRRGCSPLCARRLQLLLLRDLHHSSTARAPAVSARARLIHSRRRQSSRLFAGVGPCRTKTTLSDRLSLSKEFL